MQLLFVGATVFESQIKQLPSLSLNIRSAVFLFGKICLVASVGFAYYTGSTLAAAERVRIAPIDLTGIDADAPIRTARNKSTYDIIRTRNIFGSVKVEEKKPTTAPVTSLKLRLVGTNVSNRKGESLAIIEDSAKREQDVFVLDDDIFNQAKLVEILPDSVRISYNGKIETLIMEEGQGSTTGRATTSGESTDGQTEFTVDEKELGDALANLPQLLSQARAVPYFKNGESIGMRLFAIRQGSLYQKLGLKNGDILKSVNDNSLSDPSQALKIFDQLKSERSISVRVERAGQETTLQYQIR